MESPIAPLLHQRSYPQTPSYRSLLHLCSSFDRDPRVSLATPAVLHELLVRSETAQVPLREACDELGEVSIDENPQENVSMPESKPEEGTDKAETISQEQSLMLEDVFGDIELQDTSVVGVQSNDFFDEFELLINGSGDFVPESCVNTLFEPLDVNDYDDNGIAKQTFDFVSSFAEKPELQVDTVESHKEEEAPKLFESDEVISSEVLKTSSYLTLQRDVEEEKPVNSTQVLLVDDDDVEEGEISGDDNDYMLVEDGDSLVERDVESNISLDRRGEGSASIVDNQEKKSDQTSYHEEKMDLGTSSIKKRSAKSKAAKDRKKANFRKKRARERKALGVTKLKLKTVAPKPKPIQYCRHYNKGRCHEGENCKFSHDFTPETKSTPCSHFATKSCMKGDDCPYDHDLSKYPCKKFVTNGFCNRGDNCLFSHKVTPQSASDGASVNITTDSSTNIDASSQSSNKQSVREAIAKIAFKKPPSRYSQRNSSDASSLKINEPPQIPPLKKPSVAPKGMSFLSLNRSTQEKDAVKPSPASKEHTHNTDDQSLNQLQQRSFLPQVIRKETSSMLISTEEHKALNQDTREPESSINLKTRFQSHIQSSLNSAMKLAAEFETAKVERLAIDPAEEEAVYKGDVKVNRNSGNISSKILDFLSSFSDVKI